MNAAILAVRVLVRVFRADPSDPASPAIATCATATVTQPRQHALPEQSRRYAVSSGHPVGELTADRLWITGIR